MHFPSYQMLFFEETSQDFHSAYLVDGTTIALHVRQGAHNVQQTWQGRVIGACLIHMQVLAHRDHENLENMIGGPNPPLIEKKYKRKRKKKE